MKSENVAAEDKKSLEENDKLLQFSFFASKFAIVCLFVTMVDWKTPKSIMKREVPYAFLGFGLGFLADFLCYKYVFDKT